MKAAVVTCFESNEERELFVVETLKQKGFDVLALTTNYSHFRKTYRDKISNLLTPIKTKSYKKNLSLRRLLSHKKFAEDAFKEIDKYNPDLLYVIEPAHSLLKEAKKYKEKHNVKVMVDVIDMWPESFPLSGLTKYFPFTLWRAIRTNNIDCADVLLTECDRYKEILSNEYKGDINTLYLAKENKAQEYPLNLSNDKLSLVYIGSINNIIDITKIKNAIELIDKEVTLNIIGDGEKKDEMINELSLTCEVIYHGKIYDEEKKKEIFSKCHAGINLYKESLYIGLTTKSIDYFCYGLPIINNIKGDTWSLVDNLKIGINYQDEKKINADELIELRKNNKHIIKMYNELFTKEVFIKKCSELIDKVFK